MAVAWSTIETAIKTWLDDATGLATRAADQSIPAGAPPVVVWQWLAEDRSPAQGRMPDPREFSTDDDGTETVRHLRERRLQLDAYATTSDPSADALHYLRLAEVALQLESVRVALASAGVVVQTAGGASSLPYRAADRIEARAVQEYVVRYRDDSTGTVGFISTADVTGSLDE